MRAKEGEEKAAEWTGNREFDISLLWGQVLS